MNRKLIQTVLAVLVASVLLTAPRAQQTSAPVAAEDRVALYQALLDLTNPWTVMCIAAHPDDEDGTSLIVMRRKFGAHTVSLFSTFGEGGQNAIGPELYEEMGAIRARETRAAAEIQGSEPHFLGLKDFGFSKSADEAFRFWGHEEALRRMVLEIRKLRPDVIITNHSVTNNDHGHHQATARLELEAFDAAADSKRFPEQLKDGVTVWQVQRLFVRARGNQNQNDNAPLVTIDPNEKDPVRGTSFAEQALSALQQHATQGPWPKTVAQMAARFTNSADGRLPLTRYRLALEAKGVAALPKDAHSFLDGLQLPIGDVAQTRPVPVDQSSLANLTSNPSLAVQELLKAGVDDDLVRMSNDPERNLLMKDKGRRAMVEAAGLAMSAEPARQSVVPGSSVQMSVKISNRGPKLVQLLGCNSATPLRTPTGITPTNGSYTGGPLRGDPMKPGSTLTRSIRVEIPSNASINIPLASHLYDPAWTGLNIETTCSVIVDASIVKIGASSQLDVTPALQVSGLSQSPIIRTPASTKSTMMGAADCVFRDFDFNVRVTNNQESQFSGEIVMGDLSGRKTGPTVMVPARGKTDVKLIVPGCVQSKSVEQRKQEPIHFALLAKAKRTVMAGLDVPIVWADARVASNLRVGYLRGFDFSLPNALNALGVESKELSVDEVKTADLQMYTSIIVDNRVYESTPGLIATNQKLLDYANAGGTLIVFYHKSNEWNPDERRKRPQLAPYKLILGDERITDETAPITFLEPQHPLLNLPNKMGQEDFAGWIQERGLYYPKEWDPQYQALLQSNDPGEAPLKGGLLVADYGRGKYIYTSMVWYRELRAGVPGAYRMLANMISYGRVK